MSRLPITIVLVLALALAVLGCGTSKDNSSSTTASATDCTPAKLDTHSKGVLTVATDKPAYPPYFVNDDPTNGEGLRERRRLRDRASSLGFAKAKVKWTVEPFNSSYAPGPKNFDFDVNEISITPARGKGRRLLGPVLHRQPGGRRAEGLRRRQGDDRWPGSRTPRSASRSARPASTRSKKRSIPSSEAAGLQQLQRRRHRAQERPGRRGRRRPADRALPDRRAGARPRPSSVSSALPAATSGARCSSKGSALTACVSQGDRRTAQTPANWRRLTQRWMSKAAGAPELRQLSSAPSPAEVMIRGG